MPPTQKYTPKIVLNQVYCRLISTSNAKNVEVSAEQRDARRRPPLHLLVRAAPPTASCRVDQFRIATE